MRHCEWSSQLTSNFTWGSAQAKETGFLGSLPQTLPCCSAQARETAFWGSLPKALRVGSAQAKETGFLGSLPQTLRGAPRKPRKPVFGGVYCELYVWAPRKLRDKPNPSSHGHGCCVSGSGPARLLIASRPGAPLRGLNVGLCGDR